jgi:hypothetical protein
MSGAPQKNPKAKKAPDRYANREVVVSTGSHGWVTFAAIYLFIGGGLNLIWGITALSKKEYFHEGGLVASSLTTWAWIAIFIAAIQILAAALVAGRKTGGMLMAIVLGMCGIFLHFFMIGAYPVWSTITIVCNALVLWAVTVHSDEFI